MCVLILPSSSLSTYLLLGPSDNDSLISPSLPSLSSDDGRYMERERRGGEREDEGRRRRRTKNFDELFTVGGELPQTDDDHLGEKMSQGNVAELATEGKAYVHNMQLGRLYNHWWMRGFLPLLCLPFFSIPH